MKKCGLGHFCTDGLIYLHDADAVNATTSNISNIS